MGSIEEHWEGGWRSRVGGIEEQGEERGEERGEEGDSRKLSISKEVSIFAHANYFL